MLLMDLLTQFLKNMNTVKSGKKHFNKNLIWVKKKKNIFNEVTLAGYMKNSLKMVMKRLEIIAT